MSTDSSTDKGNWDAAMDDQLDDLKKWWWCFLLLGIALIILGCCAMGMAYIAQVVTVIFFGVLLLVAGVTQIVSAFWTRKWRGFLLQVLIGVLYIVVGFLMLESPVEAGVMLTLLIACFLLVAGIFRIITALTTRFRYWGWTLLNGVITVLLGIMIWKEWPSTGLFVIGLFVGIEMIFNGWSWVMLAMGISGVRVTREERAASDAD